MFLARTYTSKGDIPTGAEGLYRAQGSLFILQGAHNDFSADNPWEPANWNLTAQGQFLAKYGRAYADAFAKAAGTVVGATRPTIAPYKRDLQVLIQRRNLVTGGGSTTDDNALATALATKTN